MLVDLPGTGNSSCSGGHRAWFPSRGPALTQKAHFPSPATPTLVGVHRQLSEEESGTVSTRPQGRDPDTPSPQVHTSLLERCLFFRENCSYIGVVISFLTC